MRKLGPPCGSVINSVQIIASLNIACGGPSRTVSALCGSLAGNDIGVTLVAQKTNREQSADLVFPERDKVSLRFVPAIYFLRATISPRFCQSLSTIVHESRADLIHSHGLWLQCNRVAAQVACSQRIPHIISTRGMLEPWAFKHRYWKKMPFWHLWQHSALEQAALLCATSRQEAEGIRRMGFRQPIAIVPNGVDLPCLEGAATAESPSVKTALFLSRIHPVKGLADLVKAWGKVRPAGWRCIVAGPDEEGYGAEVKKIVAEASLDEVFEFVGPVYGQRKFELFRSADLFVLPTQSENFGVAIAEALAYQVPVITTKGAPWSCLQEHRCGWWADLGVEPLEQALREACAQPREVLQEMGQRGRQLVEKEFSWQGIGASMKSVYEWVLHGGEKPACVIE